MWIWTKVVGRALINVGMIVLGIVAAKELVGAAGDALWGGDWPSEPPPDSHPIPPMA